MTNVVRGSILIDMTTLRTYLESDQLMLAVSSTCAKREWTGGSINQPSFAVAHVAGRPEASV